MKVDDGLMQVIQLASLKGVMQERCKQRGNENKQLKNLITQQAAVQEKLTRELKEVTEKLNEKTNENNALKVYIAQLEQQLLAMHAQNPMVQVTVDQKNHVSQSERTKTEFNNPITIDKAQDVVAQGGTKHVA